jgi:ATP-dependent Lhr-like helicase
VLGLLSVVTGRMGRTMTDVFERFSPATTEWFRGAFDAPTPAQAGAWDAISTGQHALVIAPTGSGKTLASFLWSIDRLISATDRPPAKQRTRVLYVSPLKALGVDVERNLRSPLVGITQTARRLGTEPPDVTVGVRSGDTPSSDRQKLLRQPPDILITTPESLYLMLTSQARETLVNVDTVIVDEVHAVASTKRGAHLAVSLERLDDLLDKPVQRIGLSATVRPPEEVARFLGGRAPSSVMSSTGTTTRRSKVFCAAGRCRLVRVADERVDLAARRRARRRPDRGTPLDDRVRELAAAGRTAHGSAQRDPRGTRARRRR